MNRFAEIAAKTLSVVLYPLFVPTYGVVLFCCSYPVHVAPLPWVWILIACIGTVLFTCVLPITAIMLLMRQGKVTDLQIENAGERTVPYLYAAMGFGFWTYLMMAILHVPLFIGLVCIGATVAIGIVALVNRHWKISAHLTAFGGMTGGILSYSLGIGAIPVWSTLCLWFGAALLLMWARLRLQAHTPEQVSAGWMLGMACTFLPYCLYSYAV